MIHSNPCLLFPVSKVACVSGRKTSEGKPVARRAPKKHRGPNLLVKQDGINTPIPSPQKRLDGKRKITLPPAKTRLLLKSS